MRQFLNIINPINWNGRTLLLVGAIIYLAVSIFSMEPIAKSTILKKFYQDIDLAARYSEQLKFDHFVTKVESDEGERVTGRNSRHYDNCSKMGTYYNNETNTTIYNAFTCTKNFISFYWLDDFSAATISGMQNKMVAQGWSRFGDDYLIEDQVHEIQDQIDGTARGFSFKRSDGINADMLFFTKNSSDYEAWCNSFNEGCQSFEKKDTTHQNIMVIKVSAYKGYEE